MKFYVKYETMQEGPFDLVAMVRKIRNGSVSAELLVLEENDEMATPAAEHPQLKSFFREIELLSAREEPHSETHNFGFISSLKKGFKFLTNNHFSAIYSAALLGICLMFAALFAAILPDFMAVLNTLLVWIVAQFMLGVLLFMFLRIHRGQPHDPHTLYSLISRYFVPLAFCAALTGIFTGLGIGLLIVPGLALIGFYCFAPLLIIDQNYDFWDAMETSRKTVLAHGRPLFEIVFGFALLNFIAGLCFVLPLAVTLPITYGALAELYDEIKFG